MILDYILPTGHPAVFCLDTNPPLIIEVQVEAKEAVPAYTNEDQPKFRWTLSGKVIGAETPGDKAFDCLLSWIPETQEGSILIRD
jgi:hypothetical protein